MKKIIYTNGIIAGTIVSAWLILMAIIGHEKIMMSSWGMVMGFASMIIAFAFVFVGVKQYRDKVNGGSVSFGRALSIGLLIAAIASTFYVLTWLVELYAFFPDFMHQYNAAAIESLRQQGATVQEIAAKQAELQQYASMYESPLGVILLTYSEILIIGIPAALLAALILKRKPENNAGAAPGILPERG